MRWILKLGLLGLLLFPNLAAAQSPLDILRGIVNENIRSSPRSSPPARNAQRPPSATQLSKQDVMRAQRALQALGYYSGAIDGLAGGGTRSAVAAWAADRGWEAPSTLRIAHVESMEGELAQRGQAAAPARAASLDWKPHSDGSAAQTCVTKSQYNEVCLALVCDYESGLGFDLGGMPDMHDDRPDEVHFRIDGGAAVTLGLDRASARTALDPARDTLLVEALSKGRALNVATRKSTQSFALGGFAEEYRRMRNQCDALTARVQSGEDPSSGRRNRLADEATAVPAVPALISSSDWTVRANTDFNGNDIRHGLTDPLLRGLKSDECAAICKETDGCMAYTHNPLGGACFLKSAVGRQIPAPGVTSAAGAKTGFAAPPTRGAGPVVDGTVGWRETDTVAMQQVRIRQAARRLGGACEEEQAALSRLASGLSWKVTANGQPRAGSPVSIDWAGNGLEERIPVWLVAHTRQPVRFSGTGHFTLGPDAPNPFAIGTGLGETRALAALATRGAGESGTVTFTPLQAGPTKIDIAVVGYLRACEREVVLKSGVEELDVAPARAEIVLSTPEGRAAFTHSLDVEKMSRRVLFNQTRFLVLDAATGTEIVERAGAEFEISPTHRFVAVVHDGRIEIVDLVDGRTAASLASGELYWGLGDSVVFTGTAPWAKIDLVSTFGDHLRIEEQLTGPSCCMPSQGETRVGFDIENATYSIWGRLGYRVGALQNPAYASIANSQGGYSSSGGELVPLHLHTFWSLGMVSPVTVARRFEAVGGFFTTPAPGDLYHNGDKSLEAWGNNVAARLEAVGLQPQRINRSTADRQELLQASAAALAAALPEQLLRMGIALVPMTTGEHLLDTVAGSPWDENSDVDWDARSRQQEAALAGFASEAEARGWRIAWSVPEDAVIPECDHLLLDEATANGGFLVPRDLEEIARISSPSGSVWAARADCTAGATFGSLRPHSAFYVIDLAAKSDRHPSAMVEGAFFFENAARRLWYQHPFAMKADERHLLTFAPGNGVIAVRDRSTHEMVWVGDGLPNGDLLVDAWLTEDRRHAVQLNSDGNFYIHSLSGGGEAVLAGRLADDEVAVWTGDYFYDATAEAAALIDLKFPGKMSQYSLDRFGAARRVDDLARLVLQDSGRLPEAVELGVPPDLEADIRIAADGGIEFRPSYDATEVARLAVLQDGVLTHTFDASEAAAGITVARLADARWLSLVASNGEGLVSLPVSKDVGSPQERKSVNRALVIGINTYQSERLPSLNYALRDAGTIHEVLTASRGDEPPFEAVFGPKDRRATPDAIVEAVQDLLDGLSRGDHAVLFLAGHGLRDAQGQFFLATSATDIDDLDGTALSFDRLTALFEQSEARITVLLDACHSGAAGTGVFATNDDLANSLAALRSNLMIFSAAKGRQESQGRREVGGLFTDAIATVLGANRQLYDTNRNGRIEASELYRGVKTLVGESSGGAQTPWMITRRMVGEYALF